MPLSGPVLAAALLFAAATVRAQPARSSLGVTAVVPPACSVDRLSDLAVRPAGRSAPAPRALRIACSDGHAPRVTMASAAASPGGRRIVFVILTY